MAPRCACSCNRPVYESYLRRGQAVRVHNIMLARRVGCAARLAALRPELRAMLRALLAAGPLNGHGSGPRRRALAEACEEPLVCRRRWQSSAPLPAQQ